MALRHGTDYKVTLANGLRSKSGDRTENAETVDVNFGDKPSRVSISGDGYILPRNTSNGLAIQTVNVDHLKIRVLRMSDRLVLSSKDVLQNNTKKMVHHAITTRNAPYDREWRAAALPAARTCETGGVADLVRYDGHRP